MERNVMIVGFVIALLALGGGIFLVWNLFQNLKASYPCSLVKADDIQKICGYENVTTTIVPDALACIYSSPEIHNQSVGNSFLRVIVLKPYTEAGTYETIKQEFIFENATESSSVVDENFIGERSFFVVYKSKTDGRVFSNKLVAFKGDAMIMVIASPRPGAKETCNNKEKMEEVASLAISRLS